MIRLSPLPTSRISRLCRCTQQQASFCSPWGRDEVASDPRRGASNPLAAARWEPVTAKLGPGTVVGETLTTPLNVTLAHAIYNNPDLEDYEGPVPVRPTCWTTRAGRKSRSTSMRPLSEPPTGPMTRRRRAAAAVRGRPALAYLPRPEAWADRWELRNSVSPWLAPMVVGLVCGIATAIAAVTGAHAGVGIGMGLGAGMIVGLASGLPFRRAQPDIRVGLARGSRPG